jgi:hypothetical protein
MRLTLQQMFYLRNGIYFSGAMEGAPEKPPIIKLIRTPSSLVEGEGLRNFSPGNLPTNLETEPNGKRS